MAISKVNFQVYADGKKRILVVENCEGETLEAFNRILEAVCGLPEAKSVPAVTEADSAKPPAVKGSKTVQSFGLCIPEEKIESKAESPEIRFPDILLMSGEYAGMTPSEAVERDGIRAVPILCERSKDVESERVRKQMVDCCKHMIALDLESRSQATDDVAVLTDFFAVYRQLLGSKCLQGINGELGVNLDEAIKSGDGKAMSKAYAIVISDLKNRTKA